VDSIQNEQICLLCANVQSKKSNETKYGLNWTMSDRASEWSNKKGLTEKAIAQIRDSGK
jgi:hypothetical protein